MYKPLYKVGVAAYLMFFLFAILFFRERTIFIDVSFILYEIIRDNELAVQVYRFGSGITQSFILLGRRLDMSLEHIMLLYSAGVAFYYFVCYIICGRVLKRYDVALGLLLFNILFVTDTFYWIQAELPQGVAMLFVLLAFVQSDIAKKGGVLIYLLTAALVITVSFFHPLLFIPGLYIVLFHTSKWDRIENKKLFYFSVIVFVIAQLVKAKWFGNPYDTEATQKKENLKLFFPNYLDLYSTKTFIKNWLGSFIWIPISSLFIIVVTIVKRRWVELALFLGFMVGYTILICASYPNEQTQAFYIENLFLPLAIIIAIPFIYNVIPQLNKKLTIGLFLLVIIMGCIRIYNKHHFYSERIAWEREFLKEHIDEKVIVDSKLVPMQKVIMTWGTCYEFWLLSTIEYGRTASIIIHDNPESMLMSHWDTRYFKTAWGAETYDQLPEQYFKFQDTVTAYKVLK